MTHITRARAYQATLFLRVTLDFSVCVHCRERVGIEEKERALQTSVSVLTCNKYALSLAPGDCFFLRVRVHVCMYVGGEGRKGINEEVWIGRS